MVKLFVGNLPNDCARRDVLEAFEKYGKVTDCDIIRNFAFVHFEDEDDADAAIRALDKTKFLGNEISVEVSTSRPRNTCKLYIGNLSSSASRRELQKMFEQYGEVAECDIIKDFGFCHMTSRREAEDAIRGLNNETYCGRRIKVQHANNNDRRSGPSFYNGMNIYSRQYREYYDRYQNEHFRGRGRSMGRYGGGYNNHNSYRRSPLRRRRSRSRGRSYSRSASRSVSRSRSRSTRSRTPRKRRSSSSHSRSPVRTRSRSAQRKSHSRSVSSKRRTPSRSNSRD